MLDEFQSSIRKQLVIMYIKKKNKLIKIQFRVSLLELASMTSLEKFFIQNHLRF